MDFYIDMDGTLKLSAVYVPSPVCAFFPLVHAHHTCVCRLVQCGRPSHSNSCVCLQLTVTNSKLLSSKVVFVLDGITRRGTKKYRMVACVFGCACVSCPSCLPTTLRS